MFDSKIKVFDVVNEKFVPLPVSSDSSLTVTDTTLESDDIYVERLSMPSCEYPEVIAQEHLLTIQLSEPHILEVVENGQLRRIHKIPGSISLAPEGVRFKGSWDKDVEILILTLKPIVISKCALELNDANHTELMHCNGMLDPQIQYIGLALEAEFLAGSPGGRFYNQSLANALAVQLLKKYSTKEPKIQQYRGGLSTHQLKRAIEYINDNLSKDVSLNDLAAVVGMSMYYFVQMFKQSTGCTPYQYILQCRVERAKHLLRTTNLPIVEIALQVGCSNQSHFAKLFKKLTQTTPKKYREK
ncbi:helix-turn-helix domain-containing protein [Hassallia byssoidea VB512170]|uniref:Helix-turn-helix domain-containing protein n=1 Tax=Hassallia byssoidea VB512170 TaxID=1304833 RepID=A0A846H2V2_9CYAN|nr:AraC family transcriptional regulator [Hassalia byssoidea]NEU71967.1 helix-turn-helix domain-containing protein [Hassalia byssoidea VB512170]